MAVNDTSVKAQSTTATLTSVTVSTVTISLLPANTNRKLAIFQNEGSRVIYLAFAATATLTAYTTQVLSGVAYELPTPAYTGAISAISPVGSNVVRITELT